MRDKRKSTTYFEQYISYEKSRILKKQEKLSQTTERNKLSRIYSNLFLYRFNLLIASFSIGEDEETLKSLLDEACKTALEIDNLTYSDALTLISIAIMLRSHTSVMRLIDRHRLTFESDKLLYGLYSFVVSGKAKWVGTYKFPEVYSSLDAFFAAQAAETKEDVLLVFLKAWYGKCKDCAWFDTLNNPNDVYYGYWCFEAAALAKIFNLREKHLSKSEYFPVL